MSDKIAVIITAAGSSTRMGGSIKKEYLPYKKGTVISSCAKSFLNAILKKYNLSDFVITCPVNGIQDCKKALLQDTELLEALKNWKNDGIESVKIVEGSSTRQASVFNGLKAVKENGNNPSIVMIHDGARPFVSEKLILEGISTAISEGASVPGITPTDTQKEIDENGFIKRHLVRSRLTAVQTPQNFKFHQLFEAHLKAINDNTEYTDDTEIWGNYCGEVKVYPGDVNNIKITYPQDLEKIK